MKKGLLTPIITAITSAVAFSAQAAELLSTNNVDVTFSLAPSVSMIISDGDLVIPNLVPGESENSNEITIQVTTNNKTGYTLSATVGDASNTTRNLVHSNSNISSTFSMIASGSSLSTLPDNTWGYSVDHGTTFGGLNLFSDENAGVEIATTNVAGIGETPFLIGANANADTVSGDYNNVINFLAVTNYVPEPPYDCRMDSTIPTNYTMQNIANIKYTAFATQGAQVKLCDTRDGKAYYAAKLADGNIWMTQNLDLDLDSTKTYTSADTDVAADWTPANSTIVGAALSAEAWGSNVNTPSSWDPGNYQTSATGVSTGCDSADLSACSDSIITEADSVGKANHYHVGNLYSWAAAVATNDTLCDETNNTSSCVSNYDIMPNSICPAGWKLPNSLTGSSAADSTNGMQSQLLSDSGIIEPYYVGEYIASGDFPAKWKSSGESNISKSPLFLSYSGRVVNGQADDIGSYSAYWSSTSHSKNSNAYGLVFTANSNMFPQYYSSRGYGYSVRCVSR